MQKLLSIWLIMAANVEWMRCDGYNWEIFEILSNYAKLNLFFFFIRSIHSFTNPWYSRADIGLMLLWMHVRKFCEISKNSRHFWTKNDCLDTHNKRGFYFLPKIISINFKMFEKLHKTGTLLIIFPTNITYAVIQFHFIRP